MDALKRNRKNDPVGIGDIIAGLKKTTPLGKQLELAQIWDRWTEIAGPKLAPHGRPYTVKKGTLHIHANSPVWVHRYDYVKWELLKKVNLMAGHELISDIFIGLASDNPNPAQDKVDK